MSIILIDTDVLGWHRGDMPIPEEHAMAWARYLLILARIERRLDEERRAAEEHAEERAPLE